MRPPPSSRPSQASDRPMEPPSDWPRCPGRGRPARPARRPSHQRRTAARARSPARPVDRRASRGWRGRPPVRGASHRAPAAEDLEERIDVLGSDCVLRILPAATWRPGRVVVTQPSPDASSAFWSRSWWASARPTRRCRPWAPAGRRGGGGSTPRTARARPERLEVIGLGDPRREVRRQVVVRLDQPPEARRADVLPRQPRASSARHRRVPSKPRRQKFRRSSEPCPSSWSAAGRAPSEPVAGQRPLLPVAPEARAVVLRAAGRRTPARAPSRREPRALRCHTTGRATCAGRR